PSKTLVEFSPRCRPRSQRPNKGFNGGSIQVRRRSIQIRLRSGTNNSRRGGAPAPSGGGRTRRPGHPLTLREKTLGLPASRRGNSGNPCSDRYVPKSFGGAETTRIGARAPRLIVRPP